MVRPLATMAVASARYGEPGGRGSGGGGGGSDSGGHAMIEIEGAKVMFNGYGGYQYRIHLVNENYDQWFSADIEIKKGIMFWVVFGKDASLTGKVSGDIYNVPGSADDPGQNMIDTLTGT